MFSNRRPSRVLQYESDSLLPQKGLHSPLISKENDTEEEEGGGHPSPLSMEMSLEKGRERRKRENAQSSGGTMEYDLMSIWRQLAALRQLRMELLEEEQENQEKDDCGDKGIITPSPAALSSFVRSFLSVKDDPSADARLWLSRFKRVLSGDEEEGESSGDGDADDEADRRVDKNDKDNEEDYGDDDDDDEDEDEEVEGLEIAVARMEDVLERYDDFNTYKSALDRKKVM